MSEQPGAATPGAVFVDPTGRRRRRAHRLTVAAGLLIGSYLVLVAVALVAPPGAFPLNVPGFGALLPGSRAALHGTGARQRRPAAAGPASTPGAGSALATVAPPTGASAATGVAGLGTAPGSAAAAGSATVAGNTSAAGIPTVAGNISATGASATAGDPAAAGAPVSGPAPTQAAVPASPAGARAARGRRPTGPPGRSGGAVILAPGSKRSPRAASRPSHPATRPSRSPSP